MSHTKKAVLIYGALILYSGLPLLSALTAGSIAKANGCALNEAGVHPCVIGGKDWGGTLYAMGVMGWLLLITVPSGGLGLAAYTVFLLVRAASKPKG